MSLLLFWRELDVPAEVAALQERIATLETQLERARKRLANLMGDADG